MKINATLILAIVFGLLCLTQSLDSGPKTNIIKQLKKAYTLIGTNAWNQFPELKITFQLSEPVLAYASYVITNSCSAESHLVTRLIVDSTQNDHFRVVTGSSIYHTNSVSGYIFLDAGRHQIRVDYRTPGSFSGVVTDWNTASLQIVY